MKDAHWKISTIEELPPWMENEEDELECPPYLESWEEIQNVNVWVNTGIWFWVFFLSMQVKHAIIGLDSLQILIFSYSSLLQYNNYLNNILE